MSKDCSSLLNDDYKTEHRIKYLIKNGNEFRLSSLIHYKDLIIKYTSQEEYDRTLKKKRQHYLEEFIKRKRIGACDKIFLFSYIPKEMIKATFPEKLYEKLLKWYNKKRLDYNI